MLAVIVMAMMIIFGEWLVHQYVVFVKIQMMHGTSLFLIEIDQIVMMMLRVKVFFCD